MLNILHNSSFYQSMEPFDLMKELEDLDDQNVLMMKEEMLKLDGTWDTYQDLIDKYINLHGAYTKELENSKKVKKSLAKCLKFYSKLCKKYEAQQKINQELEENIKQKTICLEESTRNQEKMKGLIEIYKGERSVYSKDLSNDLRRDKEILLDICCKLIRESVKTNNIRSLANLLLKKFKKDLDNEKLNVLISKDGLEKYELNKVKELDFASLEDIKPSLVDIKFSDEKFIQSNDFECETKAKKETDTDKDHTNLLMVKKDLREPLESTNSQSKVLIMENFDKKIGDNSDVGDENMINTQKKSAESITVDMNENCGKLELQDESEYQLPELYDSLVDEDEVLKLSHLKGSKLIDKNKAESENTALSVDSFISNNVLREGNSTIEEIPSEDVTKHDCNRNFSEFSASDFAFQNFVHVSDVNRSLFDVADLSNDGQHCNKSRKQFQDEVVYPKKLQTSSNSLFDIPEVENENHKIYLSTPLEFQYPDKKSNSAQVVDNGFGRLPNDCKNYGSKERTHVRHLSFNEMKDSDLLSDKELSTIFNVMSSVERLSPIRETKCTTSFRNTEYCHSRKIDETSVLLKTNAESDVKIGSKRNGLTLVPETSNKPKKLKSNLSKEISETEKKDSCHLLDSIISAMTVQNEKFKSNSPFPGGDRFRASSNKVKDKDVDSSFTSSNLMNLSQGKEESKQIVDKAKEQVPTNQITKICEDSTSSEKTVLKEIKNFVSLPISSNEHAQMCVQRCVSILANKSDEVIAKSMVSIVFENVNEEVKILERPAPPLTRTEHRLMVLLSVFNTLHSNCESICSIIMAKIFEKLFPDVLFWPDASVEAASRFYTALCRKQNDVQSVLKFFLKAMTEMKLRCFLTVFTALKTWPDILQNASVLRNNVLAVTIVNIFLYMPKKNVPPKYGRLKKLLALKHLLMNFYEFTMDESIETHGKKILQSFLNEELNSEKALMLLCSHQEYSWIKRNIIPELKKILVEWSQGKLRDSIGIKVLSVIKHISAIFEKTDAQANEMISNLSQVLNSGKLNHSTELCIIELLLEMKQFSEARRIVGEWIPKCEISKSLRDEIIEVSAENVLQEIKPQKSLAERSEYGKLRKQNKGKKKTGKKWRKIKNRTKIKDNKSTSKNSRNCVKKNNFK